MNRTIYIILFVAFSFLYCSCDLNNEEVRERTKDSLEMFSSESQLEQIKAKQLVCRKYKKWIK